MNSDHDARAPGRVLSDEVPAAWLALLLANLEGGSKS